jgi:SAM-dependent methyltransferase
MLSYRLDSPATAQGQRICFKCGAASEIASGEDLWPKRWQCRACGSRLTESRGFVQLAPNLDTLNTGFDVGDFDALAQIEPTHFWFVARNELIEWLVRRFVGNVSRAMEIGCGTGYALRALRHALPSAKLIGTELHSNGLVHARARHADDVELIQMDARCTGLREAVDLIGAFDVLEHIPDDEDVLRNIFHALKPGGTLIATVPQHPWMWSAEDERAHHQRRYRIGELAQKAERAGLVSLYRSSYVALAFPLMALSRLTRGSTQDGCADAEFHISSAANYTLLAVCRAEHLLRRIGLNFPFGGSQVLVAQRPSSLNAAVPSASELKHDMPSGASRSRHFAVTASVGIVG